jgi:predicted house-cleaning noncanonical NTP pyrophosphatase (MazG superfamily)
MKDNEIHRLLETAQANYGYGNQIAVAMEELSELGSVLPKYLRYDFHDDAVAALKDKVLEETADVVIVLRHIQMIFGIQPNELEDMMDKKLNRLKRWLENDDKSFHHTTEDRAIEETDSCESCYYWEHVEELKPDTCSNCPHRQGGDE